MRQERLSRLLGALHNTDIPVCISTTDDVKNEKQLPTYNGNGCSTVKSISTICSQYSRVPGNSIAGSLPTRTHVTSALPAYDEVSMSPIAIDDV